VTALFVDFGKTFDHVEHLLLLNKTAAVGVQPFVGRWMHSFLFLRQQRVKLGDVMAS
jgi:hypothetical protein